MFSLLVMLLGLIIFIILCCSIPVTVAAIAYASRKSKRKKIMETLPSDLTYSVPVRLNTPKQNDAVMKLKAFEYSGVLYIHDNKICIKGTKGQYTEFNMTTCSIDWPGVQIQNGLIQWLCLTNNDLQRLYVNAETGLFIFRLSKKFPSTKEVFEYLKTQQNIAAIGR